ncbi:hypothetical protein F4861DRAFT_491772 [Xylaria intraflava]|nr:hypothetical protein F4861DRAFT_491772 [Xylaria intraflava]
MADRVPPANLRQGTRTTRAGTSIAGVRRNLFQSQLTRRPTSGDAPRQGAGTTSAAGTVSSSDSAGSMRLDVDVLSDSSEIVIRDQNGEFEIGNPPTPPLDDIDDEPVLDGAQENERERHKLAEAVRHHQVNHTCMPAQPEGNYGKPVFETEVDNESRSARGTQGQLEGKGGCAGRR